MFNMFGRTGAPTLEGPPHMQKKFFSIFYNYCYLLSLIVKMSKKLRINYSKLLILIYTKTQLLHMCGPLLKFSLSGRFISKSAENEMIQFADLAKSFAHEQINETSPELFLYRLITKKRLKDTFPNVEIALRILSCSDGDKLQQ